MNNRALLQASSAILNRAGELGATLAGFASLDALKDAPSVAFAPRMPEAYAGWWENDLGLPRGHVKWHENAKTLLVVALAHPEDQPEMDWWFGMKNPPGNRRLIRITRTLGQWIGQTIGVEAFDLPYRVEKGGTFLKDAAVLAGLGCIGKNNLLITPEFGPRIRLRALAIDAELPSTGPRQFNPCSGCREFCRKACPGDAFEKRIYSPETFRQDKLPGQDGHFFRPKCKRQMERDEHLPEDQRTDGPDDSPRLIKYCRKCELACPVGTLRI